MLTLRGKQKSRRMREGERNSRKIAGSSKRPLWEVALCPEYEDRVRADGPGHFIVPRAAYLKDKRLVFFYGLFNSSVNHLLAPPVRLHWHKLYLGRYFQAVHVAAIFISKRYTARDVHSVYPNNIAPKSRRCLFHVMGIISLFPLSSFLLVIARRRFVRRRERTSSRNLGHGINSRRW